MDKLSKNEVLDVLKKQVLAEKRNSLVKYNLTRYIPYLKSKYVISMDDQEEIEHLVTMRKKNDKIIDILLMRTAKAYDHFCDAILDLEIEAHLVTELNSYLAQKYSTDFDTLEMRTPDFSGLPRPSSVSHA